MTIIKLITLLILIIVLIYFKLTEFINSQIVRKPKHCFQNYEHLLRNSEQNVKDVKQLIRQTFLFIKFKKY